MEENSFWVDGCHQALRMEEIMQHIFKFCSVGDLRSCREVSTLWHISSGTQWRSRAVVTLDSPKKMEDFTRFVRESEIENCFGNFRLNGRYTKFISEQFLAACGNHISTLDLDGCEFHSTNNLRNLIYHRTPLLEKLVLRNPTVKGFAFFNEPKILEPTFPHAVEESAYGENWNLRSLTVQIMNPIGISYMELLSHFPGLKALCLDGMIDTQDMVFPSFVAIRKRHPHKLHVKEVVSKFGMLRTHPGIGPHMLDALVDASLQIDTLSLGVNDELGFPNLERVIKANMSSLKKIHLDRFLHQYDIVAAPIPINCQLDNLTELVVHHELLASFEFLKFTPNLVTFAIVDKRAEKLPRRRLPASHSEDLQNTQLTRCVEFKCSAKLSVKELDQFMSWLPNVERLTMGLDNDTFGLVCERWRNLTLLEMASSVDECGITGMSAEDVDTINIERRVPNTVKMPNLTNLKHLRHLHICAKKELNLSLGYCGVTYGVKQLPNLLSFDAEGYVFHITEDLRNELRDRFHSNGNKSYGTVGQFTLTLRNPS